MLYAPVDNLSHFVHPVYNRRFSFMTEKAVLELAVKVVESLERSSIQTVIISESGAAPLARICEKIASKRGYNWQWVYVKFPREPVADLFPVLSFYLSAEEKNMKEVLLKTACDSNNRDAITSVFEGTEIHTKLKGRCLFFDEYIDSGTTLKNALYYLPLLSKGIDLTIGAYYANLAAIPSTASVAFHLYDESSKEQCFTEGVYPFENRIDLIGYWYTWTGSVLKKTVFQEYPLESSAELSLRSFINSAITTLNNSSFHEIVTKQLIQLSLKTYLNIYHVLHYTLYLLEEKDGTSVESDLMQQLFEMYSPIWSPLPDEYHLEFVAAFESARQQLTESDIFAKMAREYTKHRRSLLQHIHTTMFNRHRHYVSTINNLLLSYV